MSSKTRTRVRFKVRPFVGVSGEEAVDVFFGQRRIATILPDLGTTNGLRIISPHLEKRSAKLKHYPTDRARLVREDGEREALSFIQLTFYPRDYQVEETSVLPGPM